MSTKRIEWIKHNGKEVLVADYSGLHSSELMDVFETGKVEVLKKDSSVLMMGIFNGTKIDNNYIATAKKEGFRLDKMIKRTAVVGMSGIQKIFFNSYILFTRQGYKTKLFDTKDKSLEWLTQD